VFLPPVPLQGPRDLVFRALAPLVAVAGQGPRVAGAPDDGLEDEHPGHPGDVGHHLGQLDVHLLQGLLHVLDGPPGVGDDQLPLPQVSAKHAGRVVRPERGGQQAVAVQPLDPLAVQHIGLGPAGHLPGLSRIRQGHPEPAALEQLEQRDPVDAGRLQGHGGDPAGEQPVGQPLQVGGATAERADVGRQVGRVAGRR
jgi:hypothetical protein